MFVYILIVHTATSLISSQAHTEEHLNLLASLEKTLAVYFFVEFLLRIWSAGADGRFQGWRGLLNPFKSLFDKLVSCVV